MLQVALQTRAKLLVGMLVGVAIGLLFVLWIGNVQSSQAQAQVQDFQEMFSTLHTRMLNEGVLVKITFHEAISGQAEHINIGYGYEDIDTVVHEIGEDYFCTSTIAGGAELIECIPFSNIATILYINN